MALERQSIEKKDFPIGRRGYDPDAVDTHLAALADEVEQLRASSRRRSETLASSASDQVRAIVEAAESSAAEIQRQAEEEAREIRTEASEEAEATRDQAQSQAREYVGKVSESTAGMLQRLEAMENELTALTEALRTGANRLNADLQLLEGSMEGVRDSATLRPQFEPEEPAAPAPARRGASAGPETGSGSPASGEASAGGASAAGQGREAVPESPLPEPHGDALEPEGGQAAGEADRAPSSGAGHAEGHEADIEGARLAALNMALNGSSRDETERYLAENFRVSNSAELIDEVYASVEG